MAKEIIRLRENGIMNIDLIEFANNFNLNELNNHPFPLRNQNNFFNFSNRLSPTLPLLQLFWQTFLPWNHI